MREAMDRAEALRTQAERFVNQLLGNSQRKRRWDRLVACALGIVLGAALAAVAAVPVFRRGSE